MQLHHPLLNLENPVQKPTAKPEQANYAHLLATIALRIRQSLNLDETLNTAVTEVRQFLQTDRVVIYRFEPDSKAAEALIAEQPQW